MVVFSIIAVVGVMVGFCAYKICLSPFAAQIEYEESIERARSARVAREKKRDTGILMRAASAVERLLPITRERERENREKLDSAGVKMSAASWRGITIVVMISCSVAVAFFSFALFATGMVGVALGIVLGAALGRGSCYLYLSKKTKARREEIEKRLPDALERLANVVVSGLTVNEALREVGFASDLGAIGEEFARVDREINLVNISQEEALAAMSRRCKSIDVSFFTSALIQAIREGAPLETILQQQSENARAAWFDRIKERINKIDVKITFPLGFFFMPASILLLVGPMLYVSLINLSLIFG